MKKLLFGLIAIVLFSNFSFSQTSKEEWFRMIENYKTSLNNILLKECPKEMELTKFKISLINGEIELSDNSQEMILLLTEPLKKYGLEFAKANKLKDISDSDLIFYSSFSPDLPIKDGVFDSVNSKLTWGEVGMCVLAALGADAAWAWAAGTGTSWSIAALTTTFTGVAKRFLGPIGVGIAVGTFTYCLYENY